MALIIVADDLTGACDAGTLFAGKAPVPVTVWPDPPVAAEVAVVDTESRRLDRAAATDRVSDAAGQRAGATSWFKKIDSTLRGHVGAEIVALLQATRTPSAVACPAFPSEGRTVLDRVLRVNGTAAAHVVDLIRSESDRPLAWIPLAEVRAGVAALAVRLARLAGMIAVEDAETDDDLDTIVGAALADGGDAAATLAREAASLLATESFDLIVLTGGDTAVAFYRTLGAARIDLVGAPGPRLALGYLRAPGYSALPVLTKAGGFGPPELFVSLRKEAMT